jgi:predicted RNA-binding protein YlxR (DUF448 family)
MKKLIIRQSILTKKYFSRNDLFRLIKLSNGDIIFDKEMKLQGRSIHFEAKKDMCNKILSIKKIGMINHFLRSKVSIDQLNILHKESMKYFE